MSTSDVEAIKKELADINTFVRERFDPVSQEVGLLREEAERLGQEVVQLQERERTVRREALAKYAEADEAPVVAEGPYSGMNVLDLGLLRRLARSQRRSPSVRRGLSGPRRRSARSSPASRPTSFKGRTS